ncbi:ATP-grasp domain-containing protein [Microtetraspora malaysiensis]|uniref:ATP-grasp domain-containing protein n=1 Tax=Microtetraspora malaysiensis TaxID=161358 RepID=UPI003D9374BE
MISTTPAVLFIGLRRPSLEWKAEIEAALSRDHDVLVHSDASLNQTGLPEEQIANFSWADSVEEIAAQSIVRMRAAGRLPASVVCWGDRYVGITAVIAEALGLRGVGVQAALVCGDKAAQRRVLDPHGLNPAWRCGTTAEELRTAIDQLGSPLIFKLAHSSGGKGAALINERTDLDALLAATKSNYIDSSAFVVERYVEGSEHSVTGLVRDGEVVTLAVADKFLDEAGLSTVATLVPSALAPQTAVRLHEAARTAVQAVGIQDGGFHVDLRLGPDGPVVLEVGARLGGDLINSHLVPLATAGRIQPYRELLGVLNGEPLPEQAPATAKAAMIIIPVPEGRVETALERAAGHPLFTVATDWTNPGKPAIAVVVTVLDNDEVPAVAKDLRAWIEA